MAIRFKHDGREYVCDTPKEVAELSKLLSRQRIQRRPRTDTAPPSETVPVQPVLDRFREGGVRPSPYTLGILKALEQSPGGLDSDTLAHQIGLGPKSLPPVMGHLNTLLESMGYKNATIISRQITYDKGRGKSLYALTEVGREVVSRLLAH